MSEEHKNCKYRFKGKSCGDCPLNCKLKRLQEEQDFWCKKSGELEEFVDKQVKDIDRLEQENKELKEELDIKENMLDKFMIGSGETLEKLQEENKELRQIRKNSPDIQEPYIYLYRQIKKQCHKLEEENKELKQQLEFSRTHKTVLDAERIKYKQALEEIRTNIQNWINSPWFCFNCRNNMDEKLKEIIKLTRF